MIDINDLITNGYGDIQITVTANDLMAFANHIIASLQNTIMLDRKEDEHKEQYLTRKEVMDLLKVGGTTLHNWKIKRWLVPVTVGRKVYYSTADVLALQRGDTISKA